MTMHSTSDMDTKLSSQTSSVILEDEMRKPVLAMVKSFSDKHSKQRRKFKGYLRSLTDSYLQKECITTVGKLFTPTVPSGPDPEGQLNELTPDIAGTGG